MLTRKPVEGLGRSKKICWTSRFQISDFRFQSDFRARAAQISDFRFQIAIRIGCRSMSKVAPPLTLVTSSDGASEI